MTSTKKKILLSIITVVVIALIITILMMNKQAAINKAKKLDVQASFPVSTEIAKKSDLEENLVLIGSLLSDKEVAVVSEGQGKVTKVFFAVGSHVGAGATLALMDDELKRAALINAEANYDKAKKDLDRYQNLYKAKSATEAQLDQATLNVKSCEAQYIIAKRQVNDMRVKSPFSGVITSKTVEVGSYLNAGTTIAYLVDINDLKVKVNVPENDVFKLHVGEIVEIYSDVYPGVEFSGKIKSISDKGDDAHTYPVEITVTNNSRSPLKAGMFAKVKFNSIKKQNSVIIPRTALIGSSKDPQVFVVYNNTAVLKRIVLGAEIGNQIEVISGLNEGEIVIVNGQFNLSDGSKVKVVNAQSGN